MGEPFCLTTDCTIPLPPAPVLGFELSVGGCAPGLDLDALLYCDNGSCNDIEDHFQNSVDTALVNAATDPRVFFTAGLCLIGYDKIPFIEDVILPCLDFFGLPHCFAELELSFWPLMGYLGFDVSVSGFLWKAGVNVEAQFYDEIKDEFGVCGVLSGEDCFGQEDSERGQNSCSLCEGQDRGKFFIEVGAWFFKEEFEFPWGDGLDGECIAFCDDGKSEADGPCGGDTFFDKLINDLSDEFNSRIFLSQPPDPNDPPVPSTVYKFEDFITALKKLQDAGRDFAFWYGDSCSLESQKAGLVNMAAFLGQAMRETIIYDACDENNWDKWRADVFKEPTSPPEFLSAIYPMSSGCGQLGQKYAEYRCEDECPEDPSMELTASTNAGWIGAPPPLVCGPKSKFDGLGYWNPMQFCQGPNNTCDGQPFYYPGQSAGVHVPVSDDGRFPDFFYSNPLPDADGNTPLPRSPESYPATNVEGCCWWGRGVIQTTGRCNFGKLNKKLGEGAGGNALYPQIDFCKNPQAVCDGPNELKWVAGIFFWVSDPQNYDNDGFNYKDGVNKFVQMGCADDPDKQGCDFLFEYASGIVNRGCHDPGESGCPGCIPGATCDPAHNIPERVEASKKVLRFNEVSWRLNSQPSHPLPRTERLICSAVTCKIIQSRLLESFVFALWGNMHKSDPRRHQSTASIG